MTDMFASRLPYQPPRNCGPDIIYCDESLLVVNKPAGLLSVAGRGTEKSDSLTARVQIEFPDALSVHRLDMNTSGLLLFARGADMHRRLSRMFRERAVMKRYIAIVAGRVDAQSGAVDLPLAADWPNRPKQKVDFPIGKPSLTRYRLLTNARCPFQTSKHSGQDLCDASRIELEPVTGRTHQLRVHMAAIGHPVLGDELYGGNSCKTASRLLLHACKLSFIHPSSAKLLTLASEPAF
ncbi:MAG: RluA family pseudouridine synthase [Gallionella sp.]